MKGQYAIAKYIPMKIRRQMVAVAYSPGPRKGDPPRCKDGKCPMGWLPDIDDPVPTGGEVGNWIAAHGVRVPRTLDPWKDAWEFIDDFDQCKIKNLRKALGVPK